MLTKNRKEDVVRMSKFYVRFNLKILIIDASDTRINHAIVENQLIHYVHMPDSSFIERLMYAITQISTKYVTWITDDDLFLPYAIKNNIDFLEKNMDSHCCGGEVRRFGLVGGQIITYPWSHWTKVSYPDPVDHHLTKARRACGILANMETASFFYLTYRVHFLIKLVFLLHRIQSKTSLFEKLPHGTGELVVTMMNIIDGNAAVLPLPYQFRAENIGVDDKENSKKILAGNDPAKEWDKPNQAPQLNNLYSYLSKILQSNGLSRPLADDYSTLLIKCYWMQVRIGLDYTPILNCLNPYVVEPGYFVYTKLSDLWSHYEGLKKSEQNSLQDDLIKVDAVFGESSLL